MDKLKPYAFCCNGSTETCNCVKPEHGQAIYRATCSIPNCRNRAPDDKAFCRVHSNTRKAEHD